jgi:hypothetical protein
LREQAESEGRPWEQNASLKPKSPEEIQAEQTRIDQTSRQKFAAALQTETEGLNQVMNRLNSVPKLKSLCNKVQLSSSQLKLIQTKQADLPFSNDLVKSLLRD